MDTVQLLFRTRAAKKGEDLLDKVQGYLAALLHNGQIVGDHTPMAKVNAGLLVTASLPEADALADRFANKWVRQRLRELAAVGVDRPKVKRLGTDPESREPCRCRKRPFPGERFAHDQLSRFDSELSTDGRELARTLEKKVRVPVYYYLSKHCRLLSNVAFDVRLGV